MNDRKKLYSESYVVRRLKEIAEERTAGYLESEKIRSLCPHKFKYHGGEWDSWDSSWRVKPHDECTLCGTRVIRQEETAKGGW